MVCNLYARPMFGSARRLSLALFVLLPGRVALPEEFQVPPMQVAPGFEVTLAAGPPLVRYPMMACFDPKGRLYIAESDGRNLTTKEEIESALPRFVRRLVDTAGKVVRSKSLNKSQGIGLQFGILRSQQLR